MTGNWGAWPAGKWKSVALPRISSEFTLKAKELNSGSSIVDSRGFVQVTGLGGGGSLAEESGGSGTAALVAGEVP